RVMSLRDGTKKMSKSDESEYSRINMTDDADTIAQKIRKAKTDPEPLPDNLEDLEKRPEADNLVTIYAALSGETREQAIQRFAGAQFSSFKSALLDAAVAHLAPITSRMTELLADKAEIDRLLRKGGERAAAIADKHLAEVKDIIGLLRP
ncbi:MAG TPA: tryptophan--tRNA ligase, partial [Azospirillum sp.]|nr:tryptophan--tRNA ligase [Azospirillum sp.]